MIDSFPVTKRRVCLFVFCSCVSSSASEMHQTNRRQSRAAHHIPIFTPWLSLISSPLTPDEIFRSLALIALLCSPAAGWLRAVCRLVLGSWRSQSSAKVQHRRRSSHHDFSVSPPDKFGLERYLHKGQCLDACPEAFYHSKERSCERCSDHCRLCTSPTHCLKCNSSYYVSDGVCAKLECGEGKQFSHAAGMDRVSMWGSQLQNSVLLSFLKNKFNQTLQFSHYWLMVSQVRLHSFADFLICCSDLRGRSCEFSRLGTLRGSVVIIPTPR